jgi:protein tyrosine/serine phosphatase
MVWRSGHPDRLDAAGWAELRARGITTVVDLRNPEERVDAASDPVGIRVLALPLEDVDDVEYTTTWDNDWATPDFYAWGRTHWPQLWSAVLAAVADSPGGVLIYCAGGRDRTGMVAAALLETAGVEREAILDDYVRGIRESSRHDIDDDVDDYRAALDRLLDSLEPETELRQAASRLRG